MELLASESREGLQNVGCGESCTQAPSTWQPPSTLGQSVICWGLPFTADGTVLTLNVAENDMGMIIGKHGKIARAIRTVAKAAAKIADKKITVEIR